MLRTAENRCDNTNTLSFQLNETNLSTRYASRLRTRGCEQRLFTSDLDLPQTSETIDNLVTEIPQPLIPPSRQYQTLRPQLHAKQQLQTIINLECQLPRSKLQRNKNDYYRYLLEQSGLKDKSAATNDVLIPRSILKRNNPGGLIKDKRLEEAKDEYIAYCMKVQQESRTNRKDDDVIGKYDALFGKQISNTNRLLSPKLIQLLREPKVPLDEDFIEQL